MKKNFGVLQNPSNFAWFWKRKNLKNFNISNEKNRKMTGNCITTVKKTRKLCRIAVMCRKNLQKFQYFDL